nr:MAG TPA: hypothetical protein [Caudoviricetes sp.]
MLNCQYISQKNIQNSDEIRTFTCFHFPPI